MALLTAVTRPSTNPDKPALKYGRSTADGGAGRGCGAVADAVRRPGAAAASNAGGLRVQPRRRLRRGRPGAEPTGVSRRLAAGRRVARLCPQRPRQVVPGLQHQAPQRRRRVRVGRQPRVRRRPASPGESWSDGNSPRTTSIAIWIDRSAHTRSITAKYCSAYGASSSRCEGCAKPAIVASTSALDSASDSTTCRPRLRLDRRRRPRRQAADLVALAGRRVVAGQFGGERRPRPPPRARSAAAGTPSAAPGRRPARRSSPCPPAAPAAAGRSASAPTPRPRRTGPTSAGARLPGSASRSSCSAPSASSRPPLVAPVRRRVVGERRVGPGVQHLEDADVRLAAREPQHQVDEVPRRHQRVPRQVPQRRPAQRPRQRVGEVARGCARSVSSEPSSKRILQYVRSSSLTSTSSGRSAPGQLRRRPSAARRRPTSARAYRTSAPSARTPVQARPPPGAAAARDATRRPPARPPARSIRPVRVSRSPAG